MASVADLRVIYSGGASNILPTSSLGGAKSTVANDQEVLSQSGTGVSNVTGVTIFDALSNNEGTGTLDYTLTGNLLSWTAPGIGSKYDTTISGDGRYVLGSPSGFLIVDVIDLSLPAGNQADVITIANLSNEAFDDISAAESLAGEAEYRCLFIENTHGVDTLNDVRIWVRLQPSGEDELDIALSASAINTAAEGPLADEEDSTVLLSGLTFNRPNTQASGLSIGALASGDYKAFWMRRTIAADTVVQELNDVSQIGISALT